MIPIIAHGIVGKQDLPIPSYLFGWGAAMALIVSFVGLAFAWREPRLAQIRERGLARVPAALEIVTGALGIGLFALTVYAGLAGAQNIQDNLAPVMIFITFWVGTAVASMLFGDVFAAINPWRAIARAVGWAARRLGQEAAPFAYPERLGRWPAAAWLLVFAWVELASQNRSDPSFLATLAMVYAAIQLGGMAVYGERAWTQNADGFAVYFRMLGRLSPLRWERGRVFLRPPGVGAVGFETIAGSTALVLFSIGSTSFDGFSAGPLWNDVRKPLESFFHDVGIGGTWPLALAATVGLAGGVALISGFYFLGLNGVRGVDRSRSLQELGRLFAHTLIPIAAAYVFAHYFSLLTADGQAIAPLLSDPLGHGSDLLGTAGWKPNLGWIAANAVWYVQVGALLAGHVTGLVLAHDRALELYPEGTAASRSQYWMLAVMVGFTSLALWLLSLNA
ncbi:MAG: fenitrothion hydrolase [Solirubrobacterales bacterium]|nr:fenitrothion hydrolase [Solirubrobacterales bacterium]